MPQFVTERVQPDSGGLPLFCGGHSLGGLVATYVVGTHQEAFAGLALSSAAIDAHWTPTLR